MARSSRYWYLCQPAEADGQAKTYKRRYLKNIKEEIGGEQRKASQSIRQLSKLMNELDQRNNMFMYAVLNGLLLLGTATNHAHRSLERTACRRPARWLNAIGEMDALCSLGTFAYNHPSYVYPTFTDKPFCFRGTELGHPLMHRDRCVRNDIDIAKRPFFIIITGANMAGKAPTLHHRNNYLLACIGARSLPANCNSTPARLVTSLRTSDLLNDNESYFFAELKRLKLIIDKLQAGEELFIILDEILKGTNSMDKQKGSLASSASS